VCKNPLSKQNMDGQQFLEENPEDQLMALEREAMKEFDDLLFTELFKPIQIEGVDDAGLIERAYAILHSDQPKKFDFQAENEFYARVAWGFGPSRFTKYAGIELKLFESPLDPNLVYEKTLIPLFFKYPSLLNHEILIAINAMRYKEANLPIPKMTSGLVKIINTVDAKLKKTTPSSIDKERLGFYLDKYNSVVSLARDFIAPIGKLMMKETPAIGRFFSQHGVKHPPFIN
jgi:hypothetical protein